MNLLEERKWIQNELESVADFWLNNGMDKVNGGVYTCLDKDGKVFSQIRAFGCRAVADGFLLICAMFTELKTSGLKRAKAALISSRNIA